MSHFKARAWHNEEPQSPHPLESSPAAFPFETLEIVVGELARSHESALKLSPSGDRDCAMAYKTPWTSDFSVPDNVQPHSLQRLGSSADTLQSPPLHLQKPTILGRSFATHYGTSGRQKNKL
ncbi:hypothetical protein PMIN06_004755 [Paraphaeosphaeria minitans]|uniref:Uncharacterized protein n=1 Tax=Paraphaeosphaeria minitans TaxID=565426 RepID=A0A9P6KW79_9PLEO|nr:hypothetical protein PMIN01_00370 [Paraphaeosphaeria minitans]